VRGGSFTFTVLISTAALIGRGVSFDFSFLGVALGSAGFVSAFFKGAGRAGLPGAAFAAAVLAAPALAVEAFAVGFLAGFGGAFFRIAKNASKFSTMCF
jgi:hypothetical protein